MKNFELIRCRNLYKMCQYLPLRSNVISLGTILPVKVFSSLKDLCTTKSSKLFRECFQTLQQYPSQYGLQLLNPFSTNRIYQTRLPIGLRLLRNSVWQSEVHSFDYSLVSAVCQWMLVFSTVYLISLSDFSFKTRNRLLDHCCFFFEFFRNPRTRPLPRDSKFLIRW